jgi:hypothetical protein
MPGGPSEAVRRKFLMARSFHVKMARSRGISIRRPSKKKGGDGMLNSQYSEKRKYKRLAGTYHVSYKVHGSSLDFDLTRTLNISRGGMLFTSDRCLGKGVELRFFIKGPFFLESLEMAGTVLESREVVKRSIYQVRIQFSETTIKQLDRLDEFIKHRLGS